MVDSKLNAIATASVTGDIPQNVNFALKESLIASFLATTSVVPVKHVASPQLDLPAIAEKAKGFTFLIGCES